MSTKRYVWVRLGDVPAWGEKGYSVIPTLQRSVHVQGTRSSWGEVLMERDEQMRSAEV
jgi:hypothetical protein